MKHVVPAAALLGAVSVTGFAPFNLFVVPIVTLAALIALCERADSSWRAAATGFAFGLGYFGAGVSWVYVSLHDFGALPAPLAAALTLVFCAILACYTACIAWGYRAIAMRSRGLAWLAWPALWTLSEWLRGWLFTGFPWIAAGYSQIPHSPLAGYAPVTGIYGVSFAIAATSAAVLAVASRVYPYLRRRMRREFIHTGNGQAMWLPLLAITVLWLGGFLLQRIEWTHPQGAPLSVSLLQGNVPQEMKWRAERMRATLAIYAELVAASSSRLIVMPETALPLYLHDVPADYLQQLATHSRTLGGDILIGIPERTDGRTYYNSVISLGTAPAQTYRKSHLVPFGEFVPLKPLFGWFLDMAQIPLLDFSRGAGQPQPLNVAGQLVAVNICYEDAFGEEIIRQLPQATLLVNVSNVAWFGRSIAPKQHLQISQARALEAGRFMLRATNTGMTAIIDHRGRVLNAAPEFTTMSLDGVVQGHAGTTPYVRWGNYPIVMLCVILLLVGCWLARQRTGTIRAAPAP